MPRFTLTLVTLLMVSAQAQPESLAGIYTGDNLRLELRAAGPAGFNGSLQVQDQSFPVKARAAGGALTGTFTSGANSFSFRGTLEGTQLRLVSDGNEYLLTRAVAPVAASAADATAAASASGFEHPDGFMIRPAAGWSAQSKDQGIALTPPGASSDEFYVAAFEDGYEPGAEAQHVQQLSQAFLQNGAQVRVAGERRPFRHGSSYRWEVVDPASGKLAGLTIYVAPSGTRANMIVASGSVDRLRTRDADLQQMAGTFRAIPPKPLQPGADNTPLAQQWFTKLRGKMVRQFYSYEGMNSNKRHYLNADGTYTYRSSSVISVDVPGASASSIGKNNSAGRWRVRDVNGEVFLQVRYSNGENAMMRITQDGRNWYLNGDKAFAVDPE